MLEQVAHEHTRDFICPVTACKQQSNLRRINDMGDDVSTCLAGAPADTDTPVLATFSKKKNRGNLRKRPRDGDEADVPEAAAPLAKTKPGKAGPIAFTTKRTDDEKLQTFKFEGNKALQQQTDQGATRSLQTETQTDRDAR